MTGLILLSKTIFTMHVLYWIATLQQDSQTNSSDENETLS